MSVTCELCFHRCALEEGRTGLCRARATRGGSRSKAARYPAIFRWGQKTSSSPSRSSSASSRGSRRNSPQARQ